MLHATTARLLLLAVIGLAVAGAGAAQDLPLCFLEVPVYDAQGNRLQAQISAVTFEGRSTSLLTAQDEYRVAVRGSMIYFPKLLIGMRRLEITLTLDGRPRMKRRVALMTCEQRTSLQQGTRSTPYDVAWTTVSGRLTGCQLTGDWWVLAAKMFGVQETPTVHDGIVRLSDGRFSIDSSFEGQRHVLVVGRGKQPIKTIAVDVVVGGKNELGDISLQGLCPE